MAIKACFFFMYRVVRLTLDHYSCPCFIFLDNLLFSCSGPLGSILVGYSFIVLLQVFANICGYSFLRLLYLSSLFSTSLALPRIPHPYLPLQ